jgi:ferredoxin
MPFKVTQNHGECIGCGACTAIASTDWKMEGDKATLLNSKKEGSLLAKIVSEIGSNEDAASACPVRCIKVEKMK